MDFDVVVVGGGVSGLAAAYEIRKRRPEWRVCVLEAEDRAGGKVRSESSQGYLFDWGPNGFQPAQHTLELVAELGLRDRLVPASPEARFRYLYDDGGLRRVPTRPEEFLSTDLLSPPAKLRALLEPLLAGRPHGEESVHEFVARHFGHEAARRLAAPMVLGVTAGDSRLLSVDAAFPAMRRLEQEHGSLLRALAKRRRRPPAAGPAGPGEPPTGPVRGTAERAEAARRPGGDGASGQPGPGVAASSAASPSAPAAGDASRAALYSFRSGMGELTTALTRALGGCVRTSSVVESLELDGAGFALTLAGGERLQGQRVVLAVPAWVAASLLERLVPEAVPPLTGIEYPDVDVIAAGFHRIDVPHALDGFGYLVPRGQGARILGVLWSSTLYPDRSPQGEVLLRVIAGGVPDPGFPHLSDEAALAQVRADLQLTLSITAEPRFWRRMSLPRAIPQYGLGHGRRVADAMEAVRRHPGLILAGNAYHGIAVNDCLRDAGRVAGEVMAARVN